MAAKKKRRILAPKWPQKKMPVTRNRRQLPATSKTSARKTDAKKMPDLSLFSETLHADTQVIRKKEGLKRKTLEIQSFLSYTLQGPPWPKEPRKLYDFAGNVDTGHWSDVAKKTSHTFSGRPKRGPYFSPSWERARRIHFVFDWASSGKNGGVSTFFRRLFETMWNS